MTFRQYAAGVAFGSSLLLGGCAPSTCERAELAAEALQRSKGTCEVTVNVPSKQSCEDHLAHCTQEDQERMVETFDCMENVSPCQPGKESEWLSEVTACRGFITVLRDVCRPAVDGDGT